MKFLHDLAISSKLLAAFAALLGLTTLLGLGALARMGHIDAAASELSGKWLPQTIAVLSLRNDLQEVRSLEQQGSRMGGILRVQQGVLLHATKRNSDSDHRIEPASLRYQKRAGMQAPTRFWQARSFTFAKE